MNKARWYVLHACSGYEKKVADSILDQATKLGVKEHIEEISVMLIKDCIDAILPSLDAVVDGSLVKHQKGNYPDGSTYYKFACPYCMDKQKRPSKKKEKVGLIFQGALNPAGFRPWYFKCHKCEQTRIPFLRFLEERFPAVYKSYKREKNASKQDFRPQF